MEHLVVILSGLVVKNSGLVVIVKLWNHFTRGFSNRKGFWPPPKAINQGFGRKGG
jgi:hypothetical protein